MINTHRRCASPHLVDVFDFGFPNFTENRDIHRFGLHILRQLLDLVMKFYYILESLAKRRQCGHCIVTGRFSLLLDWRDWVAHSLAGSAAETLRERATWIITCKPYLK
jgi:hypothetical protein